MGTIVFLFLCVVWGTTWIAIKITLQGMPPFVGAAARFLVAVVFLFLFSGIVRIHLGMPRRSFKILFVSAILMYLFDYGLVYWGEQYLSAGVTAIFFATFPIFTALFATFVFQDETFHWTKFIGLIVGFSGVIITFYDQLISTQFDRNVIYATLAIISGAAAGAISTVMVKKYLSQIHPVSLSLHQMLWGVLGLAVLGFLQGEFSRIQLTTEIIFAVLYLGAVGSALAFGLYFWLLKKIGAISLSLVIYVTPIIALIADWMYFGETVAYRTVIGMLVIFLGISIAQSYQYRNYLRQKRLLRNNL